MNFAQLKAEIMKDCPNADTEDCFCIEDFSYCEDCEYRTKLILRCEEIVKDAIDKIERAVKSNPSIHGFDNAALIALAKVNEELFGDVK